MKISKFGHGKFKKRMFSTCGKPAISAQPGKMAAETVWEDIPDDFVCPVCGVGKEEFSRVQE